MRVFTTVISRPLRLKRRTEAGQTRSRIFTGTRRTFGQHKGCRPGTWSAASRSCLPRERQAICRPTPGPRKMGPCRALGPAISRWAGTATRGSRGFAVPGLAPANRFAGFRCVSPSEAAIVAARGAVAAAAPYFPAAEARRSPDEQRPRCSDADQPVPDDRCRYGDVRRDRRRSHICSFRHAIVHETSAWRLRPWTQALGETDLEGLRRGPRLEGWNRLVFGRGRGTAAAGRCFAGR